MKEKYIVLKNHSLNEYKNKYRRVLPSLISYSTKDVEDFDKKNSLSGKKIILKGKKWWLINNTYYQVPRFFSPTWFKNLNPAFKICGIVILTGGVITAITLPIVKACRTTFSVSFVGDKENNHLTYIGKNSANKGSDYILKFSIDYTYELSLDNIHVYIGGKEDKSSWSFLYQTNVKNQLTIKKEYIKNDIVIYAGAHKRTSSQSLYGFEIPNDILLAQYRIEFRTGDDFKEVFPTFIPQLKVDAYPVYEDDTIKVTVYSTDGKPIKNNLWMRTNARYAKLKTNNDEEYDFEKYYSNDRMQCTIYVPHFIIRDNGSICLNPGVPA